MRILKVEEKGVADTDLEDDQGNPIEANQLFLRGNYLKTERSRSNRLQKFSVLTGKVLVDPSEVFELFIDMSDDLSLEKELGRESHVLAGEY